MTTAKVLWKPSVDFIDHSHLSDYQKWLERQKSLTFRDYDSLWQWSVDHIGAFWESLWEYFGIISHSPYTKVLSGKMPRAKWFEGATLNYAEHVFLKRNDDRPAIIFTSEMHDNVEITWAELHSQVASMAAFLKAHGVVKGDRVAAFLPNIPEATIAFLAAASIGATWSSCSPDFGANSVADRFAQIEPKVLFACDGYSYGGKHFDKKPVVQELCRKLGSVETLVLIPFLNADDSADFINQTAGLPNAFLWNDTFRVNQELHFEAVPFEK